MRGAATRSLVLNPNGDFRQLLQLAIDAADFVVFVHSQPHFGIFLFLGFLIVVAIDDDEVFADAASFRLAECHPPPRRYGTSAPCPPA